MCVEFCPFLRVGLHVPFSPLVLVGRYVDPMYPFFPVLLQLFSLCLMASIDDLRSRFSLTEEEEQGVDVPCNGEVRIHHLAARIFTKRVANAKSLDCWAL